MTIAWQYVRQLLFPFPNWTDEANTALGAAVGTNHSIDLWPPGVKAEVLTSFENGAALGYVAADYDVATIVATARDLGGALELRAAWSPP